MKNDVFKRCEYKYLINEVQYQKILDAMRPFLMSDIHGNSTIQSLYYDTDDYRLIRRSIEKPEYKEKLRVRSYGLAKEADKVFLELKKKYCGVVFKRRIELALQDINSADFGNSQISKEIDYFFGFYGVLTPKMLLIYDRTAFHSSDGLRVTFDKNIRFRTDRLSLSAGLDGKPLLADGKILMEIKTQNAIPLWLVKCLSKEKIYKTSFSKYGEAYKLYRRNFHLS